MPPEHQGPRRGLIISVAAYSLNRVLGHKGKLPWHLPKDLRFFREVTKGHPIIMGRPTFESLGKPLPARTNIVITSKKDLKIPGCIVVHSLEEAIREAEKAPGSDKIFIGGGGVVYGEAMPYVDQMYLTLIHGTFEGDAFFPEFKESEWKLISEEKHHKDAEHAYDFDFLVFERRNK